MPSCTQAAYAQTHPNCGARYRQSAASALSRCRALGLSLLLSSWPTLRSSLLTFIDWVGAILSRARSGPRCCCLSHAAKSASCFASLKEHVAASTELAASKLCHGPSHQQHLPRIQATQVEGNSSSMFHDAVSARFDSME